MKSKRIVGNIDDMFAAFSKYDTIRARQIESLKQELSIQRGHSMHLTKELGKFSRILDKIREDIVSLNRLKYKGDE